MITFTELHLDSRVQKALTQCRYTQPTPIQAKSIPEVLAGNDVVASAQTGTGKTAAFVLPALNRLISKKGKGKPRVLILTPTRELAQQITAAVRKYGKFVSVNLANLVGGMPYRQQLRDLSRAPDFIIATPGRLLDHLENRRLDLSGIEMLVLDEADRMLDMGFIDDVKAIAKLTPKHRQTLLFSATIDSKLTTIVQQLLNNPVRIDLSNEKLAPIKIQQKLYLADNQQHKTKLLQAFLSNENVFKAIIFSATKINADKLANHLKGLGLKATALHGDLSQNKRNKAIDQLRSGKVQFVVATDVAARGIDVPDISHVINYDLPRFCEDYVHRIGRTGRAGKSGIAISFAMPSDISALQRIERFTKQKLERAIIVGLEPVSKSTEAKPAHKKSKKSRNKNYSFGKAAKSNAKHFAKNRQGKDRHYAQRSA